MFKLFSGGRNQIGKEMKNEKTGKYQKTGGQALHELGPKLCSWIT